MKVVMKLLCSFLGIGQKLNESHLDLACNSYYGRNTNSGSLGRSGIEPFSIIVRIIWLNSSRFGTFSCDRKPSVLQ